MSTPSTAFVRAIVRVDGTDVDPRHLIAGSPTTVASSHAVEVCINAKILVHELQESGVAVSEANLREFVDADARSDKGRAGYLTISRSIIAPLHRLRTITPKWIWTETSDVDVRDGLVRLVGRCVEHENQVG